ncbi:hypothetical protein ACWCXE_30430 [Streptomyces sp. NPDC001780]
MSRDRRPPAGVVLLDLRHCAVPHDDPHGGSGHGHDRTAEDPVTEALARARSSDVRRFLVLDDAARLVAHQLHYERLYKHGPAQVLCLAVGGRDLRALGRPHALRPPTAGVLWIPEAYAGAGPVRGAETDGPEDDDALRPLLELLGEPLVFDAVLTELADVLHGVGVPAARVLEHDLTEEARTRAWRQALERLTGQEIPTPALVAEGAPGSGPGGGDAVPAALAPLLGHTMPRSLAGRSWLVPGAPAETRQRACGRALEDAEDGYERVRGLSGLFGRLPGRRARPVDLPERLERLADELGGYRDVIAGALSDGGGDRLRPDQRGRLLKRGIDLPEIPEASRGAVGPGLRTYTERLIEFGLPLRSVAARLGALSDLSAPAGSAARLARLDEICPPGRLDDLASPVPFRLRGSAFGQVAPVFLLALLAGLWPGPGWVLGPAAGVVAAALTLLMLRRRPNRSYDGRLDGGGSTPWGLRLLAGPAGGAAGAVTGRLTEVPVWAGATALVVAVAGLGALLLRDWSAAVDLWWTRTDVRWAARALTEIDDLLARTAVHDWLFADARYHCSDGARAVARLVRDLAGTAEDRISGGTRAEPAGWTAAPATVTDTATGAGGQAAAEPWSWDNWGDSAADDGWSASVTRSGTTRDDGDHQDHRDHRDHRDGGNDWGDRGERDDRADYDHRDHRTGRGHRNGSGHQDDRGHRNGSGYQGGYQDDEDGYRDDGWYERSGPDRPGDDRAAAPVGAWPPGADGDDGDDGWSEGTDWSRGDGGWDDEGRTTRPARGDDDRARGDARGGATDDGRAETAAAAGERRPPSRGAYDEPADGPLEYDVSDEDGAWPAGRSRPSRRARGPWPRDPRSAGPAADPPWLERERGDGGAALVDTLHSDLADGALAILAAHWAAVEADPAQAGRASLRAPMTDVLDAEHALLQRDGATSAPPFAREPGRRPGAAELLGVSADRAGRLLGPDGGTGGADETVPLCAAEHRRMLSKDPTAVRQVRFAPEAMRRGTEADLPYDGWYTAGEDVVWTPGGRHAGVLRLVPLRSGIVRTVRGEQREQAERRGYEERPEQEERRERWGQGEES